MNHIYKYLLIIALFSFMIFSLAFKVENFSVNFNYPVVFVSRNHTGSGNIFYSYAGLLPGMGPYSRFKVTGGKLLVRDEAGSVTVLIDSTIAFSGIRLIDVQQPCVNWDGNRILFSGIENRDSSWRIYEIKKDGSGFRKITHTDRKIYLMQFGNIAYRFIKYDDIDPVYLPDGKIVFSSTRYPTIAQSGSYPATNLYIADSTGENIFRITSERNSAEKPAIDPVSGNIVYSRWWLNIDLPSNLTGTGITRIDSLALTSDRANIWQINSIKPDGDAVKFYSGDPQKRITQTSYRPRLLSNGNILSVYNHDMSYSFTGSSTGIRFYNSGLSSYQYIYGVDTGTALYNNYPQSYYLYNPPYATDPVALPDGRIMLSAANSVEAQDYGIYICNQNGTGLTPVFDLPGTLELNSELLIAKPKPPIVEYLNNFDTNTVPPTFDPSTFYQGGLFRFDCLNIYTNAPVDDLIDDAPPITKNAKIRFYLNFQRQDENGLDNPILFREADINFDGKILQSDIPANVSMFEQITDSNRKILVNGKRNIAHVSGFNFDINGSGTKCVGCHTGHSAIQVPINNYEAAFTNLSTSATVTESSKKFFKSQVIYSGKNVIDRKARTLNLGSAWVASGSNNEFVELKWSIPIDVREIKLYNIYPNPSEGTNIQVNDCEIFLYRDSNTILHIPSTGKLSSDGKSIPVLPIRTTDRIKIVVKNFEGTILHQNLAGLAEVEINARISNTNTSNITSNTQNAGSYYLEQNYPNPFNPATKIRFNLPKSQYVSLKVFDITGRLVTVLAEGKLESGSNTVEFNASSLSSGVYFYTIKAGDFFQTKKMLLLK